MESRPNTNICGLKPKPYSIKLVEGEYKPFSLSPFHHTNTSNQNNRHLRNFLADTYGKTGWIWNKPSFFHLYQAVIKRGHKRCTAQHEPWNIRANFFERRGGAFVEHQNSFNQPQASHNSCQQEIIVGLWW